VKRLHLNLCLRIFCLLGYGESWLLSSSSFCWRTSSVVPNQRPTRLSPEILFLILCVFWVFPGVENTWEPMILQSLCLRADVTACGNTNKKGRKLLSHHQGRWRLQSRHTSLHGHRLRPGYSPKDPGWDKLITDIWQWLEPNLWILLLCCIHRGLN